MLLWFAGGSIVIVWVVFRSASLDYRLIVAGAVLPGLEGIAGRDLVLHTLLAPVVVMLVVMAFTRGHRLARRRWLCLPIGMFVHLVLDGVWTTGQLFWWPAFGLAFPEGPSLVAARPVGVDVILEGCGLIALVWAWKRFGLADRTRRRKLWRTGQLDRALVGSTEAGM